ncbi:MAG: NAD(P)/FAD-dependent oxidoreductase [Clostridia bacterium]|nr:NAD(P)/FAD-dependent oxidoreductase [Clostridia bacterium]
MYDVIIIGAGVIGALTARELAKYELRILVVEKENDAARGASCANSGIVHAGFDAMPGTLKARLNVLGSNMMKDVAAELDVPYRNNGSMVLAFSPDEDVTIRELRDRGAANGVKGLRILSAEEIREIEPNISPDATSALYAPTGSIICPYSLTFAALGNAMDNGTDFLTNFEVCSIARHDGRFDVTAKDGRSFSAGFVINCAGINSDEIATHAGSSGFTVKPRIGEYMLLDKECGGIVKSTVFNVPTRMGKGILVSPTVHGNIIIGPTSRNNEDKEDTGTTQQGLDAVAKGALKSVPSIPTRSVITSFAGTRAVGSTGDFIIDLKDGFVNCAGIESPGLSASPAIAVYVKNLLIGAGLALKPKAGYLKGRRICKASPEKYNKVVCRCELISEGEIISAIRTHPGATDIDGIKKRTRAGMGRCQGGFCQPFVAEIISRELGIPYGEITKSGEGSGLFCGRTKEI